MLPSLARRYSSTAGKAKRSLKPQTSPTLHPNSVRSAHVRLWDTVKIRDVFHLVQAIERKYGKIQEFKCDRDYELKSKFQSLMFVTFAKPESLQSIAPDGDVLRVTVPGSEGEPLGGAGLDELLSALPTSAGPSRSSFRQRGPVSSPEGPTHEITCRISPARQTRFTPSNNRNPPLLPPEIQSLGRELISWAGFHSPDQEPTGKYAKHVDRTCMERSLLKWSRLTKRPMPGSEPAAASPPLEDAKEMPGNRSLRRGPLEWQALPSKPLLSGPRGRKAVKDPSLRSDDPISGLADAFLKLDPNAPSFTNPDDPPTGEARLENLSSIPAESKPLEDPDARIPDKPNESAEEKRRRRLRSLLGDLYY